MDEIAFFKYMLSDLEDTYSIDTSRVYATGHSWGSQMTHMLALNEPEMFAAVAPLSGFIFNDAIFKQADAVDKNTFVGVPVYMSAGTEGSTEWGICPVPLTEDNVSGRAMKIWSDLNKCKGTLDWSKINGGNTDKGSLEWQNGGAFKQDGRWYTLTGENAKGVPMVQAEIVDYMPHATMPEHSARIWNNWFSHYSRNTDGTISYQK